MSFVNTTDEDTEEFVSERARPASDDSPRRRFRVRPISGGLGPALDPRDPKAIKNFLNELDDEHYFDVLRRSSSREE